jgi:hypothetical protein
MSKHHRGGAGSCLYSRNRPKSSSENKNFFASIMERLMKKQLFPFATCNQCCDGCNLGSHACSDLVGCDCSHLHWEDSVEKFNSLITYSPSVQAKSEKNRKHRQRRISTDKSQLILKFEPKTPAKKGPVRAKSAVGKDILMRAYVVSIRIEIKRVRRTRMSPPR